MSLKILFASSSPHLPQIVGGLAVNTHELIAQLSAQDHSCSVLTRLAYGNAFGLRRATAMWLQRHVVSCDTDFGYAVHRTRRPWTVVDRIPRPDVAVVQDGRMLLQIAALQKAGIPTLAYIHGLEFEDWSVEGRPLKAAEVPRVPFIVNSQFTARRFHQRYGIDPTVIRPVFHAERYRTQTRPTHVTFINPVPEKGREIALAVARACPEIPFVFVLGWPLSPRAQITLRRELRGLPNVVLHERTYDMRTIYATTRLLFAPSVWERETWGRVASEAHCNAIPVLGSNRGGLPEAIGPGGVVVPVDAPIERWTTELRRLWSDQAWYEEKVQASRAYAQRAELDISEQARRFLQVIEELLHAGSPAWPHREARPSLQTTIALASA